MHHGYGIQMPVAARLEDECGFMNDERDAIGFSLFAHTLKRFEHARMHDAVDAGHFIFVAKDLLRQVRSVQPAVRIVAFIAECFDDFPAYAGMLRHDAFGFSIGVEYAGAEVFQDGTDRRFTAADAPRHAQGKRSAFRALYRFH